MADLEPISRETLLNDKVKLAGMLWDAMNHIDSLLGELRLLDQESNDEYIAANGFLKVYVEGHRSNSIVNTKITPGSLDAVLADVKKLHSAVSRRRIEQPFDHIQWLAAYASKYGEESHYDSLMQIAALAVAAILELDDAE